MTDDSSVRRSLGNVFSDLGRPDADLRLRYAKLDSAYQELLTHHIETCQTVIVEKSKLIAGLVDVALNDKLEIKRLQAAHAAHAAHIELVRCSVCDPHD
jgi:hypothetical protein